MTAYCKRRCPSDQEIHRTSSFSNPHPPLRQGVRDTDVDMGQIDDQEEGDFLIGWIIEGEWLRYTVHVLETGEGLRPG